MATWTVLTASRSSGPRVVEKASYDGSVATLDTACGSSGITMVLNEPVLRASNSAANLSSVAEELLEELRSALHNQTRV